MRWKISKKVMKMTKTKKMAQMVKIRRKKNIFKNLHHMITKSRQLQKWTLE